MKLYKTRATRSAPETDLGSDVRVSWQGSQTEASKARTAFRAEGFKKSDVTSQEMDVPTTKDALMDWLNENVKV